MVFSPFADGLDISSVEHPFTLLRCVRSYKWSTPIWLNAIPFLFSVKWIRHYSPLFQSPNMHMRGRHSHARKAIACDWFFVWSDFHWIPIETHCPYFFIGPPIRQRLVSMVAATAHSISSNEFEQREHFPWHAICQHSHSLSTFFPSAFVIHVRCVYCYYFNLAISKLNVQGNNNMINVLLIVWRARLVAIAHRSRSKNQAKPNNNKWKEAERNKKIV